MKKFILHFVFLTLIMSGCSSDSNSGSSNPCGNISDFTVTQNNELINFNLVSSATPLFYEVSVLNNINSLQPQDGSIYNINNVNQTFTVTNLGMTPGNTYLFFIRTVCTDGTRSDWSAAKSLTVSSFCYMPFNLRIEDHNFIWSNNNPDVSQYQVEYGINGFTLGTGTSALVASSAYLYVAMQENITYDFYVRASCNGSLGLSNWAGPYTYLCPVNYNACNIPSNLGYSIQRNFFNEATGANITWDSNGEINYEFTFVGQGQPISAGTIFYTQQNLGMYCGLNQSTNYNFYVRAVCRNGNKTPWAGPLLINIGT